MTMNILSLPPELLTRIFDEFASSLELKRVMRRRVVNHQFKRFIDDAIFRLCLLDGHKNKNEAGSCVGRYLPYPERDFIAEYFAYQASMAKEPTSLIGRIWRAAEVASQRAGDAGQASAHSRLKSLCLLSLKNSSSLKALFRARRRSSPTECSTECLAADDRVAAVYLGDVAYIETLVAQGINFCGSWGDDGDLGSDIFGSAFDAASLTGNVPMIRLLLSSSPHYDPPGSIMSSDLQRRILRRAGLGGYTDAFDYALDSGPSLELEYGETSRLSVPGFDCLRWAISNTPSIGNYERGARMFLPNSQVFEGLGHINSRLAFSAGHGHVDKMKYFLGLGASPVEGKHRHLLWGIGGGNPEVIRLLLAHGADPNQSSHGETALMKAARVSSIPIAKLLIEAGARLNEGSPPPIVVAVFKEDMEMFTLLRGHGARLDTPETGNWAMAVAQFHQLDCMVRMLEQQGVEKDAVLHRCANIRESYDYEYIFAVPPHLEWEHDPEVAALLGVFEEEESE
ncbi:unnamed protein product [Clonostachys rosea]|uniref:F-box domain-containing protein n=1 Tax=Bionectria ochroleuca TaxID=29856 RepID=A0ABY6UP69_BIOOC|nr:unnamed protein product [Clonostachys rosea]